jgi:hypothetical protein
MSFFSKVNNYFKKSSYTPEELKFIWKYMDLNGDLIDEIKEIYLNKLKKTSVTQYAFFQVLDVSLPTIMGKKVYIPGLIYSPGRYTPPNCHKDPIQNPSPIHLAVNIPLINCENSKTILYKCDKTDIMMYRERPAETKHLSKCQEIDSYVLNKPILFNTQVLHAVFNYSDEPRIAISLRFEKNPIDWI